MVGTKDPLRDMSFDLLRLLIKLKRDVKLVEYEHFPHGFLNYGVPIVGLSNIDKILTQIVDWVVKEEDAYQLFRRHIKIMEVDSPRYISKKKISDDFFFEEEEND
jgi:hypothetical protein